MRIPARFSLALLLAAFPLHAQETPDPIEFSQEEYNQRVARENGRNEPGAAGNEQIYGQINEQYDRGYQQIGAGHCQKHG